MWNKTIDHIKTFCHRILTRLWEKLDEKSFNQSFFFFLQMEGSFIDENPLKRLKPTVIHSFNTISLIEFNYKFLVIRGCLLKQL